MRSCWQRERRPLKLSTSWILAFKASKSFCGRWKRWGAFYLLSPFSHCSSPALRSNRAVSTGSQLPAGGACSVAELTLAEQHLALTSWFISNFIFILQLLMRSNWLVVQGTESWCWRDKYPTAFLKNNDRKESEALKILVVKHQSSYSKLNCNVSLI